ncbi:MAG: fluoride efflux transporter CrcB [Bacteroidota bacterium]
MTEWLAVFLGGGLGSLIRFALSRWLGSHENGFPLGTLAANVLSCIVLGLAFGYFASRSHLSPALQRLILVGFCGGFSTFSTFSLESLSLIQNGQWLMALAYIMLSVISCLAILWVTTRILT